MVEAPDALEREQVGRGDLTDETGIELQIEFAALDLGDNATVARAGIHGEDAGTTGTMQPVGAGQHVRLERAALEDVVLRSGGDDRTREAVDR